MSNSFKRSLSFVLLLATLGGALPAAAQSDASRASAHSAVGLSAAAGSIVAGSASVLVAGSTLVVVGVEQVGAALVVVLKGAGKAASEAATVSVRVAASTVGTASLAVGSAVTVVAEGSGQALYLAGKLIAFIPNELGRSLVYSAPVTNTLAKQ